MIKHLFPAMIFLFSFQVLALLPIPEYQISECAEKLSSSNDQVKSVCLGYSADSFDPKDQFKVIEIEYRDVTSGQLQKAVYRINNIAPARTGAVVIDVTDIAMNFRDVTGFAGILTSNSFSTMTGNISTWSLNSPDILFSALAFKPTLIK